jgi:hypothetical protein
MTKTKSKRIEPFPSHPDPGGFLQLRILNQSLILQLAVNVGMARTEELKQEFIAEFIDQTGMPRPFVLELLREIETDGATIH